MFTGLVECLGTVIDAWRDAHNLVFRIRQESLAPELSIDESIAHNGICLTVEKIFSDGTYQVTAIEETILKTTIGDWQKGDMVNIERAMKLSDRLGGHIVQGHIDSIGTCIDIIDQSGSTSFVFSFDEQFAGLIIEKGSIAVNGTSLTCFDVTRDQFTVSIIPYTMDHTIFNHLRSGQKVNLEFDLIGKYFQRNMQLYSKV